MVKLLDPLGSSEARGKIGGTVYNTWRGISYARAKVTPANPNTEARLAARAKAKLCTARWQSISDLQRSWWNDYATSHVLSDWRGKPKRISGFNWFMKANYSRVALSLAIVDTPPLSPAPAGVSTITAEVSGSALEINWTLPPGYSAASQQVDIWISYPMSPGRQPKIEDCKHLAFIPAEDGTYTTPALLQASYGIFARVIHEEDGLSSPWRLVKASFGAAVPHIYGPSPGLTFASYQSRDVEWSDPENILILDGELAYAEVPQNQRSDDLGVIEFDFSVPPGDTITGIELDIVGATSLEDTLFAQLLVTDPIGDEKSQIIPVMQSLVTFTFGSNIDTWGAALTPAIINDPLFGIIVSHSPNTAGSAMLELDYATLTIFSTS